MVDSHILLPWSEVAFDDHLPFLLFHNGIVFVEEFHVRQYRMLFVDPYDFGLDV